MRLPRALRKRFEAISKASRIARILSYPLREKVSFSMLVVLVGFSRIEFCFESILIVSYKKCIELFYLYFITNLDYPTTQQSWRATVRRLR